MSVEKREKLSHIHSIPDVGYPHRRDQIDTSGRVGDGAGVSEGCGVAEGGGVRDGVGDAGSGAVGVALGCVGVGVTEGCVGVGVRVIVGQGVYVWVIVGVGFSAATTLSWM